MTAIISKDLNIETHETAKAHDFGIVRGGDGDIHHTGCSVSVPRFATTGMAQPTTHSKQCADSKGVNNYFLGD